MLPITAVLPVYHRVPASQFARSLESLQAQTERAAEILIVVDGPSPDELDTVIVSSAADDDTVRVIRLPENLGVAVATQRALEQASNRWIARQDADDISLPHRFETLWKLVETGRYAAVGGAMDEFEGAEDNVVRTRRLPSSPDAARRYARVNNPISNPTSIIDGHLARELGGVRDVRLMEDYDLVARMLGHGAEITNTDEVLVKFRADPDMFQRRGASGLWRAEWQMQRNLHSYGLISRPRMLVNYAMRQGFRALPFGLLKRVYALLFDRGTAQERQERSR